MASSSVEPWLAEAVGRRSADFALELRQILDGAITVPNLDWTVTDLGQHVACLPKFWFDLGESGDSFERPDDFAAFSADARSHIVETNPGLLADLVESEFERFLAELQQSSEKRWLYGVEIAPAELCGLAINELVLHRHDLVALTYGKAPKFTRQEANAAVDGMMVTTPLFIDENKAKAQPDGVYHVRFRGGNDYTWTKSGPKLMVSKGRPEKCDARLIADPSTFLLTSLGRSSQIKAALSGGMISYGLRPWRFLGLGTIAVDGV